MIQKLEPEILESGKVYVLGSVKEDIPSYEKLKEDIGTRAKKFFRLRYQKDSDCNPFIPYGSDHYNVIKTVDVLIREHIPKDAEKILDIGGSGGSRIVDVGRDFEKHVVDITIPEKRKSGVYFTQADINKSLPYDDASFDCATLLWTIAHVLEDNRRGLVEEIHRVLKPGGYLYLKEMKVPDTEKERKYFKKLGDGYEFGDYFYAIFKLKEGAIEEKRKEAKDALITGKFVKNVEEDKKYFERQGGKELAMYGSALTSERLEMYYKDLFNLDGPEILLNNPELIGFRKNPGKVIKEIKPESEGVWLAVLKK